MTCEATVAIVVDTAERELKLDHNLKSIPRFLSRVNPGNYGFRNRSHMFDHGFQAVTRHAGRTGVQRPTFEPLALQWCRGNGAVSERFLGR